MTKQLMKWIVTVDNLFDCLIHVSFLFVYLFVCCLVEGFFHCTSHPITSKNVMFYDFFTSNAFPILSDWKKRVDYIWVPTLYFYIQNSSPWLFGKCHQTYHDKLLYLPYAGETPSIPCTIVSASNSTMVLMQSVHVVQVSLSQRNLYWGGSFQEWRSKNI